MPRVIWWEYTAKRYIEMFDVQSATHGLNSHADSYHKEYAGSGIDLAVITTVTEIKGRGN